jgi:death-on-curing protein
MEYLSAEDILQIHHAVIEETGGSHGLRDLHLLLSAVELPRQQAFGKELYPGIFTKAAVYVRNIIFSHPFVDGNKRTAMASGAIFLVDNGYEFRAKAGEVEAFALKVIMKKLPLEEIAEWLKTHTKRRIKR